ncbi:LacI family DNA-binding transcriptional regulator [Mangrovicella endophytica]|uniref:LacI family DNA-binding transcriptional regulator n=1 Tax=Mangrovicella endophytica TaxID=2066697 RepID=UPI001FDFD49F|nr:LacI family DNA-binding transcriptional regulator [Mangrovicella endophytica]
MTVELRGPVRITMQTVARAAGVSPMTVSNTFRYPDRVQEATRRRVLDIAAELGYVPNRAAGDLASGQSRVVGAVVPSLKNSSFYMFIRGISEAASECGYELVISLAETPEQELAAVQTFLGLRVAGLILVGSDHERATVDLLRKTPLPVVEAWATSPPVDMGIGYSVRKAMQSLLRIVLDRGFRRVGFVGFAGDASQRYSERLPAFRDYMAEAGLDSSLIHLVDEADGFSAGPAALNALHQRDAALDAILCPTDIVAAGVLFECGRRDWPVPERIAVTGWGDFEIASEITPQLTTVDAKAHEIGRQTVAMIRDRIDERQGPSFVDLGFSIVRRASV